MSIISFLGLGSVFDTKLPIYSWLYDVIDSFVKRHNADLMEKNMSLTEDIKFEMEKELYRIIADQIHERRFEGVHRECEDIVRANISVKLNPEEIRKAVNYLSKIGEFGTAMHYITCEAYPRVLRMLLEARGNPNLQAMKEETPLQKAIKLYDDMEIEGNHQAWEFEAYLRIVAVLLCYQADKQRLKAPNAQKLPDGISKEFDRQEASNKTSAANTLVGQLSKAIDKRYSSDLDTIIGAYNIGLITGTNSSPSSRGSSIKEFNLLPLEIGILQYAARRCHNSRGEEVKFYSSEKMPHSDGAAQKIHIEDNEVENYIPFDKTKRCEILHL